MLINQDAPRRRPSDGGEDPARSIEREEPVPLHRDSEGISPDIAALRHGPRAERAVDDATRDPRPDQAVAARAGCASRVERRSRSGRIADTTKRTSRDPALFRPLDGTMSRMSMRRKAQEMRLP